MEAGKHRAIANRKRLERAEMVSLTKPGGSVLARAVNDMQDGLSAWMRKAKTRPGSYHANYQYLKLVPTPRVSAITCRFIIDRLSSNHSLQGTASGLGRMIENEYYWLWLRKVMREDGKIGLYNQTLKFFNHHQAEKWCRARLLAEKEGYEYLEWPDQDRRRIGQFLFYMFKETTGLVELVNTGKGPYVNPSPELREWYDKANQWTEEHSPIYMPMVEPPKKWTNPFNGGYLTNIAPRFSLIRTSKKFLMEMADFEMPTVYHAVNSLQGVQHRINPFVLDAVSHLWENSHAVAGLPMREDFPEPEKPIDYGNDPERDKVWRQDVARVRFKNREMMGTRIRAIRTILLAKRFRNEPAIYFPWSCDFRGRMYPVPPFLNPQGNDLSKGLLTFAKPMALEDDNAASWLAIHGANAYGVDKVSFDDRIQWVYAHEKEIKEVAKDPNGSTFWHDASEPFQFLAWCHEWAGFLEHGLAYESSLPVAMDGSNNGLQLFSLLLRDEESARNTNVLPTDAPEDVYQIVADKVNEILKASDHKYAAGWLKFGVDRKATKRATMTLPYGATRHSASNYVREWYFDQVHAGAPRIFLGEEGKACHWLATIVWDQIGNTVNAATRCMDWMRQLAKACVDSDVAVRWQSPAGFPVRQDYRNRQSKVIYTYVAKIVRAHTYNLDGTKKSYRRSANAISPNIIHSIDAAVAMTCTEFLTLNGVKDFNMIHDSFSAHARNAGILAGCLRESVIQMFRNDVLADIRNQIQLMLPDVELPPTPEYGNLDVEVVRDSQYFFA